MSSVKSAAFISVGIRNVALQKMCASAFVE